MLAGCWSVLANRRRPDFTSSGSYQGFGRLPEPDQEPDKPEVLPPTSHTTATAVANCDDERSELDGPLPQLPAAAGHGHGSRDIDAGAMAFAARRVDVVSWLGLDFDDFSRVSRPNDAPHTPRAAVFLVPHGPRLLIGACDPPPDSRRQGR